MLFNTLEYLLFFLTVVFVARLLSVTVTTRLIFLLSASYVFYFSNNGWLLLLILASTTVDYIAGLTIAGSANRSRQRAAVAASMVTNLTILGYYKYVDFFGQSVSRITAAWGFEVSWVDLNVVLPVGISFYTFQSMSYTIDVYRGAIPRNVRC